jgi:LmbE family N-acetylglucosaminyl deacetylase
VRHVYLSPHLDDAVLSCGASIHRQAAAGKPVLVITFFAGEAGVDMPLSPFALVQHEYWGNAPQPMALRCAEDMAALTLLGAEARHLDYLDAVYRVGSHGQWLYTDLSALLGDVHPEDPLLAEGGGPLADRLLEVIPTGDQAMVYAPLGVGRHVDHQLVHAAARAFLDKGYPLAFYEDYPYAERAGALETALIAAGAEHWPAEARPLDAEDLAAKVSALAYYRTQMSALFGGAEAMPSRVWAFALTCSPLDGLAERIFWPARG